MSQFCTPSETGFTVAYSRIPEFEHALGDYFIIETEPEPGTQLSAEQWEQIKVMVREAAENYLEGQTVSVDTLMHGTPLDPLNRTDRRRLTKVAKECNLLQYNRSSPAAFVRIANGGANGSQH